MVGCYRGDPRICEDVAGFSAGNADGMRDISGHINLGLANDGSLAHQNGESPLAVPTAQNRDEMGLKNAARFTQCPHVLDELISHKMGLVDQEYDRAVIVCLDRQAIAHFPCPHFEAAMIWPAVNIRQDGIRDV